MYDNSLILKIFVTFLCTFTFIPQIILNYKLKSPVGLNFYFIVFLNLYNCCDFLQEKHKFFIITHLAQQFFLFYLLLQWWYYNFFYYVKNHNLALFLNGLANNNDNYYTFSENFYTQHNQTQHTHQQRNSSSNSRNTFNFIKQLKTLYCIDSYFVLKYVLKNFMKMVLSIFVIISIVLKSIVLFDVTNINLNKYYYIHIFLLFSTNFIAWISQVIHVYVKNRNLSNLSKLTFVLLFIINIYTLLYYSIKLEPYNIGIFYLQNTAYYVLFITNSIINIFCLILILVKLYQYSEEQYIIEEIQNLLAINNDFCFD